MLMKRFIQFILITVMVAGASWVFWQDYTSGPGVDHRLVKYVNEWKQDMDSAGISYNRIFNLRLDTIEVVGGMNAYGYCYTNHIEISEGILGSEWVTRQAVYHELGHHVLSLDHVDDKCIMFEKSLGEDFCRDNWNSLVSKYINKAK